MTPELICKELNMNLEAVWNIYPYGSRVYGTADEKSDHDFIIVFKNSLLESGGFKDNAVSNGDKTIQGTAYSRGGFIDAINNYMMPALESISLPDNLITKKKFNFKINKFDEKEMVKSIITQSSNSWHIADLGWQREHRTSEGPSRTTRKAIWHSIRMLMFGLQLKENQKVIRFDESNELLSTILEDQNFKPSCYLDIRDGLFEQLRK